MEYAVELKNVSFKYPGTQAVLRDISLEIPYGQTVVIGGLSGCGKTTLCRIICGIIPHAAAGELTGEVLVCGERHSSLARAATRVGMVFQDSDAQIIGPTVGDELAFGPENLDMEPSAIRRMVDGMAQWLGLEGALERGPETLSGGEKRLLALGGVLLTETGVIVMDKPMSSLDDTSRGLVRGVIEDLRRRGRTLILVEYDLSEATYADRWIIISDGGITLDGPPEEIMSDPDRLRALDLYYD